MTDAGKPVRGDRLIQKNPGKPGAGVKEEEESALEDEKKVTREGLASAAAEAQRTVDEVRKLLENATHQDLATTATAVREKLAEARAVLENAAAGVESAIGPVLQKVEQEFTDEIEVIEDRIRDNPLGSLLAAAGIGLLLGIALSRKR
jgi:ElaB/YqjD/DUF883 family membrane-anchored ribosome-binding protein